MAIDLNQYGNNPKPALGDPISGFLQAMSDCGIACAEPIIADGKIHRFHAGGEKYGKKSGWYVLFIDGDISGGAFGDWRDEFQSHKWCSKGENEMSATERMSYLNHIKRAQELRERELINQYEQKKIEAQAIWNNAPSVINHPYLIKKGVPAHDLRITGDGQLIIPVRNYMDEIYSLQFISADGSKLFMTEAAMKGNYFVIHGDPENIYICEGYSTGATIHQATGGTIVVAFNCHNIMPVTQTIKTKYPTAKITICADNDQWKPDKGNAGMKCAIEASEKFGVKMVHPEFKDGSTKPTDFNDLYLLEGIDAVKLQIKGKESLLRVNLRDWTMDAYQGEAPARKWLIEDTIPEATVTVLAAAGDAGKGMISLQLALQVACPYSDILSPYPQSFGHNVMAKGTAIYFTAEDDRDEIHRRLEGIDVHGMRFHAKDKLIVVPLPNAGGPIPLVVSGRHGPESTMLYSEIRQQLLSIHDLKLVIFDPMSSFICADVDKDNAVGSFTMGLLASLATETGATVMMCHHVTKESIKNPIKTMSQARAMVRGASSLVDNSRSTYVLWTAEPMEARKICRKMNVAYAPNRVFFGGIVKSNGPADRNQKIFVRNDNGLLVAVDDMLASVQLSQLELDQLLIMDIAHAASIGHPFTQSGANGLIREQKHRLSDELKSLNEKRLEGIVIRLLDTGEIVKCTAKGSTSKKWLDVPTGKFALGIGEFELGKGDEND